MSTYNVNPGAKSGAPSSGYTGSSGSKQKSAAPFYPGTGGGGPVAYDPIRGPGSIEFDLTDPQGAVEEAGQETADVFDGIRQALFGGNEVNPVTGKRSKSFLGDIPILGDVGRGVSNVLGGAGDVFGAGVAAIGGTLERIPANILTPGGSAGIAEAMTLEAQFNALPDDSPAKQAALAQMEADKGFLGTDILSGKQHYMSVAIQEYGKELNARGEGTDMWNEHFRPAGSLSEAVSNLFGVVTGTATGAVRLLSEVDQPGSGDMDRLDMIMAVGDGHAAFKADEGILGKGILAGDPTTGLNATEQIVYDKVRAMEWDRNQALDFLASRHASLSHSAAANIAGEIAFDPLNIAAGGALAVAKLGRTGAVLAKTLDDARQGLAAAEKLGDIDKINDARKAVEVASGGIRDALKIEEGRNRLNVLGKLAETQRSGDIARSIGRKYGQLEGTKLGKAAKVTRTVMDPMHAISIRPRGAAALDEGSREVMHAVTRVHGEFTWQNTVNSLRAMDAGEEIADGVARGLAIYAGNVFRRIAARNYVAVQMGMADKGEGLFRTRPYQALRGIMANQNKRALTQIEEESASFIRKVWSAEDNAELVRRAARMWSRADEETWAKQIAAMSADQKSMLHAATYGEAVKGLHAARAAVRAGGQTGALAQKLDRLILVNKRTLTTLGADGILNRLEAATSVDAQIAEIRSMVRQYRELRNFVEDPTHASRTVEEFKEFLQKRYNYLPSQITDAERAELPEALRLFDEDTRDVFTIGFRPTDEFLWGLERDGAGMLRVVSDPWMDQVSDNLMEYIPVREVPRNVAGKPIVGAVAKIGAKALDAAEAAGRTAFHGVTGTMVSTAARNKFIQKTAAKWEEAGISEAKAEGMWKALMDKVEDSENISGARGLSKDAIWKAVHAVIPPEAKRAGFTSRDLLVGVLDAYDGDLRFIGLTQKFTGKVKLLAAELGFGNTAGVIAEHLWPLLKFRYNPIFQAQEKIEPWVLNAWRGQMPARGVKFSAKDKEAAAVYRTFVEKNLINMADNDIAELGRRMGLGKGFENMARQEGGRMNAISELMESLIEVQGVKQLNMLRTFRKGLGKGMKDNWEKHMPGEWQRMLDAERARLGSVISDDDFALHLAQSNIAANDVFIKDGVFNFEAAIKEGQWAAPSHLGELRPLDMEYMVHRLALTNSRTGETIMTQQAMREALASGDLSQETINRALRDMGASKDYISRVESAFDFSWPVFWSEVSTRFSLSADELASIQETYVRIARSRGMEPVEYLSQVYAPHIANGREAAVGSLGALVDATRHRSFDNLPDLGVLRGVEGQADIQELFRQMGTIMSAHLDPSAKRAILLDMMDINGDATLRQAAVNGDLLTDIREIEAAFASMGTDALSTRIMNFMMGQPGTGPYTVVADEATGIADIRNVASELLTNAGRPRNMQRTIHADSDDMARVLGEAFDQMDGEYIHVATADDLAKVIDKDELAHVAGRRNVDNLKSREAARLPRPVVASYEARLTETRQMYRRIIAPRSEGGMGIRITASRTSTPYANADALRADLARGKLKVPNSGYWHPIIRNEDLFMERVVSDVFGYGQEANAFGSHDAAMRAASMYSDEARGTVLADGFARQSYETHGTRVITQPTAHPTTVEEFEAWRGGAADRVEDVPRTSSLLPGQTILDVQSRTLGTGIRSAPPEVQREFIETVSRMHRQFPGVQVHAYEIAPLPHYGVTLQYGFEHPSIVVGVEAGWQSDEAARLATRGVRQQQWNASVNLTTSGGRPRRSNLGVPSHTSATPTGDLVHEWGHALEIELYRAFKAARGRDPKPGQYLSRELSKFMREFKDSEAMRQLSEYAFNPSPGTGALRDSDMFAELFDMSFNPEQEQVLEEIFGSELHDAVVEFQRILEAEGIYVPQGVEAAVNPHAGKTIAEANAAGAGIRASYKPGALPQDVVDQVTQHFIGSGRYAEANPDIGRMAGFLRNHMRDITGYTLEEGQRSPYAHFFDSLSGMPVDEAAGPFNFNEALLWNGAAQMMAAKWEDAFRLQYFAQNRSMFQRSINHPMFGLYPASYMWGKIGPEMIRFMAMEPFGAKTGLAGYTLMDLQKSVAMHRQYDPEFDAQIEKLGESPALSFLSFMLPATPWEVPASYPAWMRGIADQGLENKAAFEQGLEGDDINFLGPLMKSVGKTVPVLTQVPWLARGLAEVGDALPWNQEEQITAPPQLNPSGEAPFDPNASLAPLEALPSVETLPGESSSITEEPLASPVTGLGTQAILEDQMAALAELLSG